MPKPNPVKGWQLDRAGLRTVGRDLQRPECILAQRDGTLWSADARGGVMRINPDGSEMRGDSVENKQVELIMSDRWFR